jgi:prepilin-type N-terminal cleavage/methylation domain-containing protein
VTATRPATAPQPSAARPGFTLVELLAVIMIIAVLAALLTPAVMRARTAARNAAIKAEIDMLHMAMMNYKNEYGSFPPATDVAGAASGRVAKHIVRLFPRCLNVAAELENATAITPQNAMVSWLLGYTDDPRSPLIGGQRKKLYDFDQSRLTGGRYHPAGKSGSPYIYIDAASYGAFPYANGDLAQPGAQRVPMSPPPTGTAMDFATSMPPPPNSPPFLNPDTFQILCAGLDETFGTDDDLSNCWPGTRKEYLDSLK